MWLSWFLGIAVGSFITTVIFIIRIGSYKGTLKIDHNNPEKDVYRLDIINLDLLSKQRRILLKVDNEADLSQK